MQTFHAALTDGAATGTAYDTQFTNTPTWELFPLDHGYGKPANTLLSYWDEGHFYSECSGKGLCDRTSGECACFDGFEGAGCARTSCPGKCSGHGVCSRLADVSSTYKQWDAVMTQQCVCDPGYTGIDCAQRECPKGDDPITRPAVYDSTVNTVPESIFALQPHTEGNEPEIQYFGHLINLNTGVSQDFALEFTDEFGDKWTTTTLDFRTATAKNVEDALEALPNNVVQDVQVSYRFLDDSVLVNDGTTAAGVATGDVATCTTQASTDAVPSGNCLGVSRMWAVTFITNSGNIAPLGIRYSVIDVAGDVELNNAQGTATALTRCSDTAAGST